MSYRKLFAKYFEISVEYTNSVRYSYYMESKQADLINNQEIRNEHSQNPSKDGFEKRL